MPRLTDALMSHHSRHSVHYLTYQLCAIHTATELSIITVLWISATVWCDVQYTQVMAFTLVCNTRRLFERHFCTSALLQEMHCYKRFSLQRFIALSCRCGKDYAKAASAHMKKLKVRLTVLAMAGVVSHLLHTLWSWSGSSSWKGSRPSCRCVVRCLSSSRRLSRSRDAVYCTQKVPAGVAQPASNTGH